MGQPSQRDRLLARKPVALAALLLASLLAYANSFRCELVLDDWPSIRDNPVIRSLGNYAWNGSGYAQYRTRWVAYLSFALNYALGGLDVTGYHVANLLIHAINALLVYALVVLTFRTPRLARSALAGSSRELGLAAALLFATHPLQSEAVTYVVQRVASLATLFYLLTVVLWVRWRLAGASRPAWRRVAGYLAPILTAVLAMKTKEIAFTLPAAIVTYEVLFLDGAPRRRLAALVPMAATALLVPISLVNLGKPLGELLASAQEVTKVETAMSRWEYLTTQLAVIVTYLRLLFLPVGQNVDHDYPLYRSILEPRVLGSLVVILALVGVAVYLFRRTSPRAACPLDPAARLVSFGIAWFFLGLSVESSVIPIVDLVFEHRVYLPSAGFFVAIVTGGALVAHRRARSPARFVLTVAVALSAVLAAATLQRNRVWASSLTLWSDAAAKSPGKTRPHSNLALALAAVGEDAAALSEFQTVVRIKPNHVSGYNNLAVHLNRLGRRDEAEHWLEVALAMKPDHAETYNNLGYLRMQQRRVAEAAELFRKAVALDSRYVDAFANLAGALNQLGRPLETIRLLEGRDDLLRDSVEARFNLGIAYVLLGDGPKAERVVSILSRVAPAEAAELADYIRAARSPR